MTKQEFWEALTEEERACLTELAEAFGPLTFEEAWRNDDDGTTCG